MFAQRKSIQDKPEINAPVLEAKSKQKGLKKVATSNRYYRFLSKASLCRYVARV